MKKRINIKVILIVMVLMAINIYLFAKESINKKYMIYPLSEPVVAYTIKNQDMTHFGKDKEKQEYILSVVKNKQTRTASVNDTPSVKDYYKVELITDGDDSLEFYVYKKGISYYLEEPYNGIYKITKEQYEKIKDMYKLDEIDKIYSTSNKDDIRNIKQITDKYATTKMNLDKAVIENNLTEDTKQILNDFIKIAKDKKEDAFIRVVTTTKEGDKIIKDCFYKKEEDKYYLITNNSLDKFKENKDSKDKNLEIKIKEYKKLDEYNKNDDNRKEENKREDNKKEKETKETNKTKEIEKYYVLYNNDNIEDELKENKAEILISLNAI